MFIASAAAADSTLKIFDVPEANHDLPGYGTYAQAINSSSHIAGYYTRRDSETKVSRHCFIRLAGNSFVTFDVAQNMASSASPTAPSPRSIFPVPKVRCRCA
jgi:hypothetical protein